MLADRVVLATGFNDKPSNLSMLGRFMGRGLHYCLHCDAYMLVDEPTYVLGHGNSAANVAMIMLNFTSDVDRLLDGHEPEWDTDVDEQLRAHPLNIIEAEVVDAHPEDEETDEPWRGGLEFADGTTGEYTGGFPMYGKRYNNQLASDFGCDLTDDGAVVVDDHSRTSVDGVYAVGDLTPGHNQIPVAMGKARTLESPFTTSADVLDVPRGTRPAGAPRRTRRPGNASGSPNARPGDQQDRPPQRDGPGAVTLTRIEHETRAMLELYQAEDCPFCTEVREKLLELGVSYVIHNPRTAGGELRNEQT